MKKKWIPDPTENPGGHRKIVSDLKDKLLAWKSFELGVGAKFWQKS